MNKIIVVLTVLMALSGPTLYAQNIDIEKLYIGEWGPAKNDIEIKITKLKTGFLIKDGSYEYLGFIENGILFYINDVFRISVCIDQNNDLLITDGRDKIKRFKRIK